MAFEEQKTLAETYVVQLICTEDSVALQRTPKLFPSSPPKYEYQCPVCKKKQISTVSYPYVTYTKKEG